MQEQLVCKDSGLSGGRGVVGTVMSLGMWEVAYIKGHQLKPPPVRMDRTGKVNDNTPPSFSSQTTPEELSGRKEH